MSRRDDPFEELEELFDQLTTFGSGAGGGNLSVDVRDEGDAFVVVADLPGFESEDIDVRLHEGRHLEIEARREQADVEEDATYVRRERRTDVRSRSITLPEPVEEDNTAATFENGVLSITLEKQTAEMEGTDIPVS